MVERVLRVCRHQIGRADPGARGDVDVAASIADAVHGVGARGARARRHGHACTSSGTLPPVTGDADALRSAVQNIVGNAVKYSASRRRRRRRRAGAAGAARVQIRVADRGLGIDAADLPHIFKPFFRGRRAVDAQVRGTGVGLSVVHHVIDAHQRRRSPSTAASAKAPSSPSSCRSQVAIRARRRASTAPAARDRCDRE